MKTNVITLPINQRAINMCGPYCAITIKQISPHTTSIIYEEAVKGVLQELSSYFKSERFLPSGLALNDMLRLKDMGTNANVVESLIHERQRYVIGMTYDDAISFLVNEVLATLTKNGYGPTLKQQGDNRE